MKIRFAFLLLIVGSVATVSSCTRRPLANLNPCTINGVVQNVPVNPQRAFDLLIVIDDSPSMRDEQAKLQAAGTEAGEPLAHRRCDTDGPMPVGEFPAVESLHVAVITPDLGYSTVPPQSTSTAGPTSTRPMRAEQPAKAGFMQARACGPRGECDAHDAA